MSDMKKGLNKRIISLVVALALIVGTIPFSVSSLVAQAEGETTLPILNDIITVTATTSDYTGVEQDAAAVTGLQEGDIVSYTLTYANHESSVSSKELPKIIAVGGYTLEVSVERVGYEKYTTAVYPAINSIVIEKEGITVEPYNSVYDKETHDGVTVLGTAEDDVIYYSTNDGVDWTEGVVPQITDAGTLSVKVKVVHTSGDEVVFDAVEAKVFPAEQKLDFKSGEYASAGSGRIEINLTDGAELDFSAEDTAQLAGGQITYSVSDDVDGSDIATISDQGMLKVTDAGTVTVYANLSSNNTNYNPCVITYTLDVKVISTETSSLISLAESNIDYVVGTNNGVLSNQTATKVKGNLDNGSVSYSIDETSITAGIVCDAATGVISISDYAKLAQALENGPLSLTVTVVKAESTDGRYGEAKASYTIKVQYAEAPETPFTFSGTEGENDWYTSDVDVLPADGYKISTTMSDFKDKLTFTEDGIVDSVVYLQNSDGGITTAIPLSMKMDKTGPKDVEISYATGVTVVEKIFDSVFGFLNDEAKVVITASDVAGVKSITWKYIDESGNELVNGTETEKITQNGESYSIEITIPDLNKNDVIKGKLGVILEDNAGNSCELQEDGVCLVYDKVSPELAVTYTTPDKSGDKQLYYSEISENSKFEFNAEFTETYLDKEKVVFTVTKDDVAFPVTPQWENNKATIALLDDGNYVIKVDGADYAGNTLEETYTSPVFIIDTKAPEYEVNYENVANKQEIAGKDYYAGKRTATIKVTDCNFNPTASDCVTFSVKAVDVTGDAVVGFVCPELAWTQDVNNKDLWTTVIEFSDDANYSVEFACEDLLGNTGINKADNTDKYQEEFCIDTTAPDDVSISYEGAVSEAAVDGELYKFYQPQNKPLMVKVTAKDAISGIQKINIEVATCGSVSSTNIQLPKGLVLNTDGTVAEGSLGDIQVVGSDVENGTVTLTLSVPAVFRGQFTAGAADYLGYRFDANKDAADGVQNYDDNVITVVDNVAPEVSIEYSGVNLKDKVEKDTSAISRKTVENVDENTRFVYDGTVTVTITAVEANFYDDMDIIITCDGVPVTDCAVSDWMNTDTDTYVKTITLNADGDYVITADYADKSGNQMVYKSDEYASKTGNHTYTSNIITIDTTNPTYEVIYENESNKVGDREYYAGNRTATIKVTDRNFRPSEVEVTITAVNVSGDSVTGYVCPDLKDWSNWKQDETDANTWILENIEFKVNANYTVEFDYADIAGNKVENAYRNAFTVDKEEAPVDVKVVYSDSIVENLFENVRYKFYQPERKPLEVTISAKDITSGIEFFQIVVDKNGSTGATTIEVPSELRIKADGTVSQGSLGDIKVVSSACVVSKDGTAKVVLSVPADFRGEFKVSAVDYAHNARDNDDNIVTVVDDTNPQVNIKYTGDLKDTVEKDTDSSITRQTVSDINENTRFIYNDSVISTITVKEANFHENMSIAITRDGMPVTADAVSAWTPVKGEEDSYEKKITLSTEGDYVITVKYADESSNQMDYESSEYVNKKGNGVYTSNIITIDKTAPLYSVAYVDEVSKQAVNGKDYYNGGRTATIKVTDRNFRPSDVEAAIAAVNVTGMAVSGFTCPDLKDWSNWIQDETNKNTWIAIVNCNVDANYTVDFTCKDLADHTGIDVIEGKEAYKAAFCVDRTAPGDVSISYGTAVSEAAVGSDIYKFYQTKDNALVKITAKDETAGVQYVYVDVATCDSLTATTINLPENLKLNADGTIADGSLGDIKVVAADIANGVVTLTLAVPAGFRGQFTASATDYVGHRFDANKDAADGAQNYDDQVVVVVDNIAPEVSIVYSETNLKNKVEKDADKNISRKTVEKADTNTRFVHNGIVTVTITAVEANFYDDMDIVVKCDGNEVTDYAESDWKNTDTDTYVKTITLSADGDYVITAEYADKSGNQMTYKSSEYDTKTGNHKYTSNIITIDKTKPIYDITYNNKDVVQTVGGKEYYAGDRTATIKVSDRNFRPSEVEVTVAAIDVNGEVVSEFKCPDLTTWSNWTQDVNDNKVWTATIPFAVDANYTLEFDYTDIATNKVEKSYSKVFTVDKEAPTGVKVTYSDSLKLFENKNVRYQFYQSERKPLIITIEATDKIAGIEYFAIEVKAEVESSKNATTVTLPTNLQVKADGTIKQGTLGFINNIVAKEDGGKVTLTFEVPAQFRGEFQVNAVDFSHNGTKEEEKVNDNVVTVVDDIAPEVSISYTGNLKNKVTEPDRETVTVVSGDTRFIYDGNVVATIAAKEANFYDDMDIVVKCDGNQVTDYAESDWKNTDADTYVKTITLSADGDYVISVRYEDRSTNEMDYKSSEYDKKTGSYEYTSNVITIDTTDPILEVTYSAVKPVVQIVNGREYYDTDRTATITITDRNFRPNEVKLLVDYVDVTGNKVEDYTCPDLTEWNDVNNKPIWEQDKTNPNTWTAIIPFNVDANYTVSFDYTDIAGHEVQNPHSAKFTVDKVNPTVPDFKYEPVSNDVIEKILNTLTFGFYKCNDMVKVTITSKDVTAGIEYFDVIVKAQGSANATNLQLPEGLQVNADGTVKAGSKGFIESFSTEKDGETTSISFVVPADFRGGFQAKAYDYSHRDNEKDDATNNTVIVDKIAPEISVTYKTMNPETLVQYVNNGATVTDFVSATQAYYNGDVHATITITDANFFEGIKFDDGVCHQVCILLTKTDNDGNVTYTEYLPKGAEKYYTDAQYPGKTEVYFDWNENGDVYSYDIDYDAEADYVLTVKYTDLSENDANIGADDNDGQKFTESYESKIITVDKTVPVVNVSYSNKDVKNIIGDRSYFDKAQYATITVMEHNFRPEDIKISEFYKAVDVTGDKADNVPTLTWHKQGNTYTAGIRYEKDANYTFDIEYKDLANNNAKYSKNSLKNTSADYMQDCFTVDKTNPKNLSVSYENVEKPVGKKLLDALTLGLFYNDQMTVTISAEDDTSGIWYFDYSYIKSAGVSSVNKELLKAAIESAQFKESTRANGTHKATATFKIPKDVLGSDNQFNGTVEFTAYDCAKLSTDMKDTKRIIVDKIKPNATITYNDPVQTAGNVSYYNGDITATIVINEANFYSDDVEVVITKDGSSYPVSVQWTDNSVDVHTGTFTLSGDGDYVVSVNYADRSTNKMNMASAGLGSATAGTYQSNQMTIDTKDPVITVTNVKNQSANNAETISITVTVVDKNIPLENFKPVLKAVIKKSIGENKYRYEYVEIELGDVIISKNANGETVYQYTINNLDADGYYTLACNALDYASHNVSNILVDNGSGVQEAIETMNFSVNREGSVFWIETVHNDKYSDMEFNNELNDAYANDKVTVKLHEINVDEVDMTDEKKTVFTLNDGSQSADITLTEGKNYEKNVRVGDGGWYENVYTLENDNFDHDGVYSINLITYDKADNSNSNSKDESGMISFTLDRTNPVISSNASNNQRVKDVEFPVEFVVSETNLDMDTLVVKLNGEEIEPESLGYNKYTFTVANGLNQSFEITAKDLAGNTADLYEVDKFTVSTNVLLLWYANTVLFWGSIIGVIVVAGGIILFVVLKKRKSEKEE